MSRTSLYSLFFFIAVGAFAPIEASPVPAAVEPSASPSPESSILLADPQQQNNEITPIQRESSRDFRQQKKTSLGKVLARAGAAAVMLALMFLFMKQMKGYLAKETEEEKEQVRAEDLPEKKKPAPRPERKAPDQPGDEPDQPGKKKDWTPQERKRQDKLLLGALEKIIEDVQKEEEKKKEKVPKDWTPEERQRQDKLLLGALNKIIEDVQEEEKKKGGK